MELSDIVARIAAFFGVPEIPCEEGDVYRIKSGDFVIALREFEPGRRVVGWTTVGPMPPRTTPGFFRRLLADSMNPERPELHRAAYSLADGRLYLHRTDATDGADPVGAVARLVSDLGDAAEATRTYLTYYVPEQEGSDEGN